LLQPRRIPFGMFVANGMYLCNGSSSSFFSHPGFGKMISRSKRVLPYY
jgi:hypothetical protein